MSIKVRKVQAGDSISARQINDLVDRANATVLDIPTAQPDDVPALQLMLLEIETLDDVNVLVECKLPFGATHTDRWQVYLPQIYTESQRTFTVGGTVSYIYGTLNSRTASNGSDPDELQRLTPPLVVGERIAVWWDPEQARWTMLGDGRMWAIEPPP